MKKLVLKFGSVADVAQFAKTLAHGYTINITACTISGSFTTEEIEAAKNTFKASEPETAEVLLTPDEVAYTTNSQPFFYN